VSNRNPAGFCPFRSAPVSCNLRRYPTKLESTRLEESDLGLPVRCAMRDKGSTTTRPFSGREGATWGHATSGFSWWYLVQEKRNNERKRT
jgi:hypothetical protein